MSSNTEVKASWSEEKSRLRKTFPTLTEKDLFFEIGKKNEMLEKLQTKLGKSKEDISRVMAGI